MVSMSITGLFLLWLGARCGKWLAKSLKDEQEKLMLGDFLTLIGTAPGVLAIASISPMSPRAAFHVGDFDAAEIICMAIGAFLVVVGFVTLTALQPEARGRVG